MSVYPAVVESFTTKTNKVDLVDAAHINAVQTSIVEIETTLGVNPQGDQADLVTRLSYNLAVNGSFAHGSSFPGSPRTGDWYYRTDLNVAYIYTGSTWSAQSGITAYVAGAYRIAGPSAIATTTSNSYAKVIEMIVPRGGTLTIKFWLTRDSGGQEINGKIYRNGSAVGTERTSTGTTAVQFSEDISGWAAGDLLQLYLHNGGSSNTAYGGALEVFENVPVRENFGTGGGMLTNGLFNIFVCPGNPGSLGGSAGTFNAIGNIGDLLINTGGGASTTLFVKTASSTWTAK